MTSPRRPGRLNGVGAWLLALLAAVGVLLFSAGTASAASLPEAGNRVRACAPETITAVGVSEHIAAGQGRGPPVLQRQFVVATGVAADSGGGGLRAWWRNKVATADDTGAVRFGRGSTEAGNRGAQNSGRWYTSEGAARRAAQRYADKHPNSCTFRGLCAAGDHYHVDKETNGYLVHTRHYYFPSPQ